MHPWATLFKKFMISFQHCVACGAHTMLWLRAILCAPLCVILVFLFILLPCYVPGKYWSGDFLHCFPVEHLGMKEGQSVCMFYIPEFQFWMQGKARFSRASFLNPCVWFWVNNLYRPQLLFRFQCLWTWHEHGISFKFWYYANKLK